MENNIAAANQIRRNGGTIMKRKITKKLLEDYRNYLYEQEKSRNTIEKYMRDVEKLKEYAAGRSLDKALMIGYKEHLKNDGNYKTTSINSFLVAANRFFVFMEWHDLKVGLYRVQKKIFVPENKELTKAEYKRLVRAAMQSGKTQIGMMLQTICATGIRVSELSAITVAAVESGMAVAYNKGKERQIPLPQGLQTRLRRYVKKNGIKSGPVFRTAHEKALDRSFVWREMKKLCGEAGVDKEKVFPHNLRHLFARTFYGLYHDIVRLADMLGHGSIETTRIYLKESYVKYREQLEGMDLLVKI